MVAFLTVRSLARDLSASTHPRDVGAALLAAGQNFGLTHLVVGADAPARPAPLVPVFSSDPNVAFDALARHPLVAEARSTDMPFGLADVFRRSAMSQDEWQRDLPPSLAARDGLVIPVHDEGRLAWFVCFAGEQAPADRHAMCVLAAASYAARARAIALSERRPGDKHVLTPREMECLRQAASGMTDSEIGRCLGISGRTVRFHIGNAKVKLGARSRLHAVTRAMDA